MSAPYDIEIDTEDDAAVLRVWPGQMISLYLDAGDPDGRRPINVENPDQLVALAVAALRAATQPTAVPLPAIGDPARVLRQDQAIALAQATQRYLELHARA